MSTRLPNIDLSTLAGQTTINTLGVALAQCGWIEFLNESPYTVELAMGGINIAIPAWYNYPIQLQALVGGIWTPINGAAFPPAITPVLLVSTSDTLSTTLLTTLHGTGETPANTTPQPLVRQTFIPNTVSTVGTTAETLFNIGSSGSAPIDVVSIDVSGDSESTFNLTSTGSMGLGDRLYPGSLLIGGAGGNLTVDGTMLATPQPQQVLPNNSTINFTGTAIHVTSGTAVAGIIMQPGTVDGQICILMNDGGNTITFAASGSNVGSGSNNIINPGRLKFFVWNAAIALWNTQAGN